MRTISLHAHSHTQTRPYTIPLKSSDGRAGNSFLSGKYEILNVSLCLVSCPEPSICQRCWHYSCLSSMTHQPEWNRGHHLHNVSSHLSTKTVIAYLAICILWDPLPWLQPANWLGGSLNRRTHTTVQNNGSPATTWSNSCIFYWEPGIPIHFLRPTN